MGQVTIYLEEEIEKKMEAAAKSAHLSKSKWISLVIQEKINNEWPHSIAEMAGSWNDFPELEQIRSGRNEDIPREPM